MNSDLSNNFLSGSIPESIGELTELTYLNIFFIINIFLIILI